MGLCIAVLMRTAIGSTTERVCSSPYGPLAIHWENLDFRLETPAVNVIVEDGVVKGVYAQSGDDIIRINAKATILATGGFGKNPEMCAERLRVPSERVVFLGFDGQDGDGINMALEAGAAPQAPSSVMYGLSKACGESWSSSALNLHPMAPFIPLSA